MPAGLPNIIVARPQPKPWWRSRVLLLNAAVLMLAAAESQVNVLQPLLPVNVYSLIAFVLPVLNAGLRFVTSTGIQLQEPAASPTGDQP